MALNGPKYNPREKMFTVSVRIPESYLQRLDELGEEKTEWLRSRICAAIDAELPQKTTQKRKKSSG